MGHISRRRIVRGAAAAAAMTLTAPSVRGQEERQSLRFVPHAELKIFDPIWTTAYITRNHGYLVYDTLFRHGRKRSNQTADGRSDKRVSGWPEVQL